MNEEGATPMSPEALFQLDGRVAIVTGASSGIGADLAVTLAAAGADVVIGARRPDRMEQVKRRVEATGRRCLAVQSDVSIRDDCKSLVESAVSTFGDLHILVNNAGTSSTVPAQHEPVGEFERVIGVNLIGAYNMSRAFALQCMNREHGGSIVNISSVLALTGGHTPQAGYSASKAGLLGLTRDLAMQWSGRKGIRVNAIAPGYFVTEMTSPLTSTPEGLSVLANQNPMNRLGRSGELAGALLLLASDAGSYITGTTIAVDGGLSLH